MVSPTARAAHSCVQSPSREARVWGLGCAHSNESSCAVRQVFYDLKQFLETNKTPVPPQLARHEAARQKPGALDGRPKRDQIQYAKH